MKKYILFIAATAFINTAMAQTTNDILKQQAGEGVQEIIGHPDMMVMLLQILPFQKNVQNR